MTSTFKPTFLYIKTHTTTGLKYFGKTTQKDPYKYKGSGIHWKRHIKKHGNGVSTEIVGLFTDKFWCMLYALEFSENNNIVSSDEWANAIPENGIAGGKGGKLHEWSKESRESLSRAMKGRIITWGDKISARNKGVRQPQDVIDRAANSRRGDKNSSWIGVDLDLLKNYRFEENKTIDQIATIMGISRSTVKRKLNILKTTS